MRVFNESTWMNNKGHHIIIIAPKHSEIYKKAGEQGWETHAVSFKRSSMLSDIFRVRSLLRKIRPDVLNTHGNTDGKVALTAAHDLGIPCIIHSRHSTPKVRNSWYNRLLYGRLCDYTFTTAEIIKDQLIKDLNVSEDHIFSLPSGIVPPDDLPEHEQARQELIAETGLPPDTRFIGYVGRISRGKGLKSLIKAFAMNNDILPQYHLVLAGQGESLSMLQDLAIKESIQDKVHFIGFKDNPWPYFRAFDCHVLASTQYEAASQAVRQAMFAGCPVIGTEIGGIPDIIIHKQTGILIPPENTPALSKAMCEIVKNPGSAKRMAEKAFKHAKENYTIDVMGKKILQIYSTRIYPAD